MTTLNALFVPHHDRDSDSDSAAMIAAAIDCIEAFTDRFNARDLAGMDAHLHFPHVIMSAETLVVWDTPNQVPADFFDVMTRDSGWDRTVYVDRQAVLVSPRKVHLLVTYTRNRADGSVISQHENLWIVTQEAGRWGIKARSY